MDKKSLAVNSLRKCFKLSSNVCKSHLAALFKCGSFVALPHYSLAQVPIAVSDLCFLGLLGVSDPRSGIGVELGLILSLWPAALGPS